MYIMGVDPTAAWTSTPEHALGTIGANITSTGTETYKYVALRNETATVATTDGALVAYLAAPGTDAEINTVVSDFTDASLKPIGAGVTRAIVAGTLATNFYGWIQTRGYKIMTVALGGTVAAGDALMASTTDMALTLATAADDHCCAVGHVDATKNVRLCCVD